MENLLNIVKEYLTKDEQTVYNANQSRILELERDKQKIQYSLDVLRASVAGA